MLSFRNILFWVFMFFYIFIDAQSQLTKDPTIELDMQVFVDDKIINDSTYLLDILNLTNNEHTRIFAKDRFVLTLNYDFKYEISIGYKKTNVKVIIVDTNAPRDLWYIKTSVKLETSKKKKRIIAGSIVFDHIAKTFVKKKIE